MKIVKLPDFVGEILSKQKEDKNIKKLKRNFKQEKICIIPSFFKFLIFMKKQKKEFGVILRTFGIDL